MRKQEITLAGLRVILSTPRVVAETSRGRCWYPDLLKFSTGELMLSHSLNADRHDNEHNSQAVYVSIDEGRTFDFAYDVNGFHNGGGEPRVSLSNGRIVGASSFLRPGPSPHGQSFLAHHWCYDQGGRRYAVEPWSVVVEGFPREVDHWRLSSRTSWTMINWFSDILIVDGGAWLSLMSLKYCGDERWSVAAVVSRDEGHHWQYLSTVTVPDDAPHGLEGFGEPCLVKLPNGDLMSVMRVGQHHKQPDQWLTRTYSSDGGRSWTAIDLLPAWSVAPQICRLHNDVLVLSTGRPGIFLWLSTDVRAAEWHPIDVLDWHNTALERPLHIERDRILGPEPASAKGQTTSYTAILEVSPNRIYLVYDRTPYGWAPVPADSAERSQIFLLEAEIQRIATD